MGELLNNMITFRVKGKMGKVINDMVTFRAKW